MYGSARKSYFQILDPIHNQGLKFCLGPFRTSSVDSLYIDAHESSLDARRAKMSLQYAIKIKSLLIHPAHNAMFDNKYTMLFDVPYVLLAFVSSNFHVLPTLISRSIWCIKPPKIVRKFGATEKDRKDTSLYQKRFMEIRDIPVYLNRLRDGNSMACAAVFPSDTVISMRLPDSPSILGNHYIATTNQKRIFNQMHYFYGFTFVSPSFTIKLYEAGTSLNWDGDTKVCLFNICQQRHYFMLGSQQCRHQE